MRAVRLLLATLAATAALAALALPAGAAERRVPFGFYGAMWDGPVTQLPVELQEAEWDRMAQSGVESVRTVFSWALAQPQPDDAFGFAHTDPLVEWAAERGMELVPVLEVVPPWARLSPGSDTTRRGMAYARFARALVERYGPAGTFWAERPELPRRPLRAWQVLNEPYFRSWRRGVAHATNNWPRGYVRLLRPAYRAIKRVDPGAKVVLAGLSNESWKYLARLYRAGARPYFDIVGQHPYVTNARRVIRALRKIRRVMIKRRDRRKRVWITELGWTATRGRLQNTLGGIETTEKGVAGRLRKSYRRLAKLQRRHPRLGGRVHFYTWASSYEGGAPFNYSGLLQVRPGEDPAPKPALSAYIAGARRDQGCVKTALGACEP